MKQHFSTIDKNQILKIKSLWEKLNELQIANSGNFQEYYRNNTFKNNFEKISRMNDSELRIEIIEENDIPIGYCVSSLHNGVGEIESLFIEKRQRKLGNGKKLIENALLWFKSMDCQRVALALPEGSEDSLGFFQKFHLYPRVIFLEQKL